MAVTYALDLPANQCPVAPDGVGACWEVAGRGLVAAAKSQLLESRAWVTQGRRRKKVGIVWKTGHRPISEMLEICPKVAYRSKMHSPAFLWLCLLRNPMLVMKLLHATCVICPMAMLNFEPLDALIRISVVNTRREGNVS